MKQAIYGNPIAGSPIAERFNAYNESQKRIAKLEAKLSELCEVSKSPCSDEIAIWVDNNTDEIKQLLGDK